MRNLLIAFLLAAPVQGSDFARQAVGTAGSEFLNMDVGARGIAMGGAYSAVTRDALSLYWNPAGLSRIGQFSAAFSYSNYVEGISYQSGAAAQRLNDFSVIAAGFRARDIGDIDHTDISGNTLGTFSPRDYVAEVGYSHWVQDFVEESTDLSVGVTGRWIRSDYLLKADGYGLDVGALARFDHGPWPYDVGAVAQNMGRGQRFDRERDTLPMRFRLGGAAYPRKNATLSLEALLPINNVVHGAAGFEFAPEISPTIRGALRGGFNSLTVDSLGLASGFSAGLGLSVGRVTFDYSFSPLGSLGGQIHQFSLSFNWPVSRRTKRYRER